ncbi:MAG TPA: NAD(P)H-quinone oxidoreductase [Mycobacteriales bacterium]|nr:NAD(P)H-quinone oxidoreductase [Mycobacteriales bacterium]
MRAVTLPTHGGLEALVLADVPDPSPGSGEVVVDVTATAVNRADLLQRMGFYDPPPGASPYPGLECSGVISQIGDGVIGWSVGQQVCALLGGGGYAERVAVPVGQLLAVPEGVGLVEAAALPEVACTVWSNLFQLARLQPGERLLVHGGASGIGTHAVQVASALGATVTVTVGSAQKAERALALGAARAVLYREEDFVAAGPFDVVLDNMGAAYLGRNTDALAVGGRLVVIGLQGGTKAELDLGGLLRKRASVHATSLRARPLEEKAAIVTAVQEHVWPLVAAGEVRPVVDRVLPLEEVAEAHRVIEVSEHVGKVLLQVR